MKQNISIKDILKFLGMVLLTGTSGLVMGFGAGYLLAGLMRNQSSGWGDLIGAIIGLFVFYPVGVILGQVIFKLRHYRGSLLMGIAGVFVGAFITVGLNFLFHLSTNPNALFGSYFILISLFGTSGYYLGRRKPRVESRTM